MLRVRLIEDPFDLSAYSEHEVPALLPFLVAGVSRGGTGFIPTAASRLHENRVA